MDLGERIAKVVSTTNYNQLSEEAILALKRAILDTLGVLIVESGVREGIEQVIGLLSVYKLSCGCGIEHCA